MIHLCPKHEFYKKCDDLMDKINKRRQNVPRPSLLPCSSQCHPSAKIRERRSL